MRRIRIKNDLTCVWHIITNGEEEPLAGRNLSLMLVDPRNRKVEIPFETDGNAVRFCVGYELQPMPGVYGVELWENKCERGQAVVDRGCAFELVPRTKFQSDGTDEDIAAAETDLGSGSLAVGVKGDKGDPGAVDPEQLAEIYADIDTKVDKVEDKGLIWTAVADVLRYVAMRTSVPRPGVVGGNSPAHILADVEVWATDVRTEDGHILSEKANTSIIGTISDLLTTAKDNVVSAINELFNSLSSKADKSALGTLSELTTEDKSSAVDAINEVDGKVGDFQTELAGKVDKVTGKGLSTNDYTDEDKEELSSAVQPDEMNNAINGVLQKIQSDAIIINGYEAVDLGITLENGNHLLWAKCNIGSDKEEEAGLYFAWADEEGFKGSDYSGKFSSSWYSNRPAHLVTEITPDGGHDSARENIGGAWRMPTTDEFMILKSSSFARTWVSINDSTGFKVSSSNGNYIFFPTTGNVTSTGVKNAGTKASYWLSDAVEGDANYSQIITISSSTNFTVGQMIRYIGCNIKAVIELTDEELERAKNDTRFYTKSESDAKFVKNGENADCVDIIAAEDCSVNLYNNDQSASVKISEQGDVELEAAEDHYVTINGKYPVLEENVGDFSTEITEIDGRVTALENGGGGGGTSTPSGDPCHYLYVASGATWNASTGLWSIGTFNDYTTEEVKYAFINRIPYLTTNHNGAYYGYKGRCLLPIRIYGPGLPLNGASVLFYNCLAREIIFVDISGNRNNITLNGNCGLAFKGCSKLVNIIGLKEGTASPISFEGCTSLENVAWIGLKVSVSFSSSPNMLASSIAYMINNAGTATIVITLHATAYARAMADAGVTAALAAKTNVSLASA